MIQYFYNPKRDSILAFDPETREVSELQRLTAASTISVAEPAVPVAPASYSAAPKGRRGSSPRKPKPEKKRSSREIPPELRDKALRLHAEGRSLRDIAEDTGLKYATVWAMVKRPEKNASSKRACKACGEPGHDAKTCPQNQATRELHEANHPQNPAQLSDDELRAEIERRVAEGQNSFLIARDLHVSLKTVNQFWPRTVGSDIPAADAAIS